MREVSLLITCEHATNFIPMEYRGLFRGEEKILKSHRGWDEGAKILALRLAREWNAPVILGAHSRLLCDLNRTPNNKGVFSEFTRELPTEQKKKILHRHHQPHWEKVQGFVNNAVKRGHRVLHLGVHSFVPVLHGHRRKTDIGLLYDPARSLEDKLCRALQNNLKETNYATHRNLPYRGTGNGLVSFLRTQFSAKAYVGLEIEINQRCFRAQGGQKNISEAILTAFGESQKSEL